MTVEESASGVVRSAGMNLQVLQISLGMRQPEENAEGCRVLRSGFSLHKRGNSQFPILLGLTHVQTDLQ